jgi:hypothetical protein
MKAHYAMCRHWRSGKCNCRSLGFRLWLSEALKTLADKVSPV